MPRWSRDDVGLLIYLLLASAMTVAGSAAFAPLDLDRGGEAMQDWVTEGFLLFVDLLLLASVFAKRLGPLACATLLGVAAVFGQGKALPSLVHAALLGLGVYPDKVVHMGFVNPNIGKIALFAIAFCAAAVQTARRPSMERAFVLMAGAGIFATTAVFHAVVVYPTVASNQKRISELMTHTVADPVEDGSFEAACRRFGFRCKTVPVLDFPAAAAALDGDLARNLVPLTQAAAARQTPAVSTRIVIHGTGEVAPASASAMALGDGRIRIAFDPALTRELLLRAEWTFNGLAFAAYAVWGPWLVAAMLLHARARRRRYGSSR